MTRTEYTNKLRKAGFSVRPLWQGKTEDPAPKPRFDLTCYSVYAVDGTWITNMILRATNDGISVFFEPASIRVSDDIAFLRSLAPESAA